MVRLPDVSARKLKGSIPGLIVVLSVPFSPRGFSLFDDIALGVLLNIEKLKYFVVYIGDALAIRYSCTPWTLALLGVS